MKIYSGYFLNKITNCQMNIHCACISRLLHIHSLEDTGNKCRISQNSRLSSAYISGYSSLMNGCKEM
jgi:ribosomal protein S26